MTQFEFERSEVQPIRKAKHGWTQCSERDATNWYVSVPTDRTKDKQFPTRSEASSYRQSLRKDGR